LRFLIALASLLWFSLTPQTISVLAQQAAPTAPPQTNSAKGQDYAAGSAPYYIAVGHLDGVDNGADLVVSNYNSDNLSVLFNKGDGTFQAAVNYAVGKQPSAVAIGDFTGYGRRDIVVALSGQDAIAILRNKGKGEFEEPQKIPVVQAPGSLIVGDFNQDDRDDILVASLLTNSVSLILSKDDDDFHAPQNLDLGYPPFFVTAGDFNNDGKLDFVTSPWQRQGPTQLGVQLGKGDGMFEAAKRFYAGQNSYQVAAGDFNQDGKLDLVTANNFSRGAHVLLGNGDGNFQTATNLPIGDCGAVITGDFNNDGLVDFAVTNSVEAKVTIMLGKGDGTFPTKQDFPVARGPVMLATADFDRDGKRDLVTANTTTNNVTVLLGKTLDFPKSEANKLLLLPKN
jgi:hypothetical protein